MYSIVRSGEGNPFYLLFFAFIIFTISRDENGVPKLPLLERGANKASPVVVAQNVIRITFLAIALAGAIIQSFFQEDSFAPAVIPVISALLILFLVVLIILECKQGEKLFSGKNIRWLALIVLFGFWLLRYWEQLPV